MSGSRGSGSRTTITCWLHVFHDPAFLDPVRELATRFEARHPEYEVRIEGQHFAATPEQVRRAVASGEAPTIVEYLYLDVQEALDARDAAGAPLFTSVAGALGGRSSVLGEPVVLADLVPAATDYFSYGGELVSMPSLVSTPLLYANTSLLTAAGVERLPTTWAELEAACGAVRALPGGPSWGVTWPNYGWFFQLAVAQQGGVLADHENGRAARARTVDLASAEMLAFVRWWRRLHETGAYLYCGHPADSVGDHTRRAFSAAVQAFGDQHVAFVLGSSVDARHLERAVAGRFDVTACRVPHNGEVPYAGNLVGGDSMWLRAGLDDRTRDGALAFMQFMCAPENAADRHRATAFGPLTGAANALLEAAGWFNDRPVAATTSRILAESTLAPAARGAVLAGFAGVHDLLSQAMHDVLTSAAEPYDRFAEATSAAQELVAAARTGDGQTASGQRPESEGTRR